jgi:hypothetical protein
MIQLIDDKRRKASKIRTVKCGDMFRIAGSNDAVYLALMTEAPEETPGLVLGLQPRAGHVWAVQLGVYDIHSVKARIDCTLLDYELVMEEPAPGDLRQLGTLQPGDTFAVMGANYLKLVSQDPDETTFMYMADENCGQLPDSTFVKATVTELSVWDIGADIEDAPVAAPEEVVPHVVLVVTEDTMHVASGDLSAILEKPPSTDEALADAFKALVEHPSEDADELLVYDLQKSSRRLTFEVLAQRLDLDWLSSLSGFNPFYASNGIKVNTMQNPALSPDTVYLRGADSRIDAPSFSLVYDSNEERDAAFDMYVEAIEEWAFHLESLLQPRASVQAELDEAARIAELESYLAKHSKAVPAREYKAKTAKSLESIPFSVDQVGNIALAYLRAKARHQQ